MNGTAVVSLHESFRKQIEIIITSAFPSNRPSPFSKPIKVKLHFTASCTCNPQNQDQVNAAYYNQRGRLHLRRLSPVHALTYMREAYRLDIANTKYRDDYYMTRVVAGKLDQNSEELLQEHGAFHDEYEFRRDKARRVEELWERHLEILREAQLQNLPREWSYIEAPPQPIPIVGPGELPVEKRTFELESTEIPI